MRQVLGLARVAVEAADLGVTVHHLNEGHAAFAGTGRTVGGAGARSCRRDDQREESTVFTTHTPVPAGHDQTRRSTKGHWQNHSSAGIAPSTFVDFGRERPGDKQESFCMTVLALRFANHVNGVAKLHGEVSRDMWVGAFPNSTKPKTSPLVRSPTACIPWMDPALFWSEQIKLDQSIATPNSRNGRPKWMPQKHGSSAINSERLVRFVRERSVRQAVANGAGLNEVLAAGQFCKKMPSPSVLHDGRQACPTGLPGHQTVGRNPEQPRSAGAIDSA